MEEKSQQPKRLTIDFSPRRLSQSYYCGLLGKHSRLSPTATPTNFGIEFGLRVDAAIQRFVRGETVPFSSELEFYVLNTPPLTEATEAPFPFSRTLLLELESKGSVEVTVNGICDVVYPEKIIEVKTGEQKEWHFIQALCYATLLEKPCQLTYVTKKYCVVVEPDQKKLKEIIARAIVNETARSTTRSSWCRECVLKHSCPEWQLTSPIIDALVQIKKCLHDPDLSAHESLSAELKTLYDGLRAAATKVLVAKKQSVNTYYQKEGFGVQFTLDEDSIPQKVTLRKLS